MRGIQDDVNFFVESNQDPEFIEDEGIYDDLNLEEAEVYGFAAGEEDGMLELSEESKNLFKKTLKN